jgi:VWFA-related protein
MMHRLLTRAARLGAAAAAWGMAQAPPPSGVTIRTTTTLVQVGVSAHDSKGRPVTDLKKEDLELFDNGKQQEIALFYGETGSAPAEKSPPRISGSFTNQLPPARQGGSAVILLDWSNTGFRNTARAREQARQMMARLGPSERVGLYSLDRFGLKVVNEVGSDHAAILESLRTLIGQKSPCFQLQMDGLDNMDPVTGDDNMKVCGGVTPLAGNVKAFWVGNRTRDTLNAFESIAAHLAGVPGRKALIWISSAFPLNIDLRADGSATFPDAMGGVQLYSSEVGRAMLKLNNADVSLYAIDARGLAPYAITSQVGASDVADPGMADPDNNTWPTMDYFAKRTGGVAFEGRNDLDDGIQAAIEDVDTGYTLGFYATQDSSRAGLHKLTVRSLRPGVNLRYKEGYYVDEPKKISKGDRKEAVAEALTALMDATAVPIDVQAARQKNTLKLRISLRPDTLALQQKAGRWQGAVEIITRFAKEDGSECATPVSRRVEFNLSERSYDAGQRGGLLFSRTLDIPAKAARLRVLVRNEPSGEIGTLTIPIAEVGQ